MISASGLLGVPAVFDSSALESFEFVGDASSLEQWTYVSPIKGDSISVQTFLATLAIVLGVAVAWSLGVRLALGVLSRLLDGVVSALDGVVAALDGVAALARRWRIPVSGNVVNIAISGRSSPFPDPELELATLA